ncbi:MAG TPA: hypothetical protein VFA93_02445 [Patescibacteria group bacterium]|nr:hypothetical protein [Patescibacteria group bacterium]
MRSVEMRLPRSEEIPAIKNDASLFWVFKNGIVKRGAELEIATEEMPLDDNGKGIKVVLLHSDVFNAGNNVKQFEHIFLSNDPRLKSVIQRGLVHWEVIGKISEAELERRIDETPGLNTR